MTGQFTWNEHQAFLDGKQNMITDTITGVRTYMTLHRESGSIIKRKGQKVDNFIVLAAGKYTAAKTYIMIYTETWAGLP